MTTAIRSHRSVHTIAFWVSLSLIVTSLCVGSVARAGTKPVPPAAKALYKAGYAAYNNGRFANALASFEKAAKLVPGHPLIVLAMAQTHRKLGNLVKALFFYQLYTSKVPEAQRYADVRKKIDELKLKLRIGKLSLKGMPNGAEVFVDDKLRGQAPLAEALTLQPGEHRLEVRAKGYQPWKRTVTVEPKGFTRLRVQLELRVKAAPRAQKRSTAWMIAGIASAAVAVGAEVTAIVLTGQANSELDGSDAYTSKRNAAIGMHAVAGAAAVGSIVSWIFYARSGREAPARVALVPTRGGIHLTGLVRF